MRLLKKERKHEVVIIYKDHIVKKEVPYPEGGLLKEEDGTAYYLDPSKEFHIFVHGYVNEIDGAKVHKEVDPNTVHKVVQQLEFEPSYTFLNAYESKVIGDFLRKLDENRMQDKVIWILVAFNIVVLALVYNLYLHIDKITKFLGVA